MLLKSAFLFYNILLINAAVIQQRNIPVRVIYDEPYKNLQEKIQLSPKELQHQARSDASMQQMQVDGRKNLYEKLQLSSDELNEAPKHLPIQDEIEYEEIKLMERTVSENTNLELFKQAEQVVCTGLENLRMNLKVDEPQWNVFKQEVENFLQSERNKLDLKQQNQQNIIQQIANGIQQIANNFQQNLQPQQQPGGAVNGTEDEQPAGGAAGGGATGGGFQNFVTNFQNGIQNLVNNLQNLNSNQQQTINNSTVLGDNGVGSTTQRPNFITNFVNGVQQLLGNNQSNQQNNQNSNGTQGDTGVVPSSTQGPPNPGQVIQNLGNQIGSAFNQIIQGGSTRPPNSEDETVNGTAPASSSPPNPIQIIQGIGNAFNQFIGGSTSQRPPGASGDEGSTPAPGGGQNFIQNIGNAIQNLNPFRPTTEANPVVAGIQNVGNQIQQQIGQQPGSGGTNPVEGVQNVISGAIPSTSTTNQPAKKQ